MAWSTKNATNSIYVSSLFIQRSLFFSLPCLATGFFVHFKDPAGLWNESILVIYWQTYSYSLPAPVVFKKKKAPSLLQTRFIQVCSSPWYSSPLQHSCFFFWVMQHCAIFQVFANCSGSQGRALCAWHFASEVQVSKGVAEVEGYFPVSFAVQVADVLWPFCFWCQLI